MSERSVRFLIGLIIATLAMAGLQGLAHRVHPAPSPGALPTVASG